MNLLKYVLGMALGAALLTGCASTHTVPLGSRTANIYGGMQLYGTSNVPFAYEELGFITHTYHKDSYKKDQAMRLFVEEAQKMGADAVVNFRFDILTGTGGFWLVLTEPKVYYNLTGVAVKITRP